MIPFGKNPPRLISEEKGYDWREFDRWLRQVQDMLEGTGSATVADIDQRSGVMIHGKVAELSDRVDTLEARLSALRNRNKELEDRIEDLQLSMRC